MNPIINLKTIKPKYAGNEDKDKKEGDDNESNSISI